MNEVFSSPTPRQVGVAPQPTSQRRLAISNSVQNALRAVATTALIPAADAYIDFKTVDESVRGRVLSKGFWFSSNRTVFDAVRPCGEFFALVPSIAWSNETVSKMIQVPGISPVIGVSGANGTMLGCMRDAVNTEEEAAVKQFVFGAKIFIGVIGVAIAAMIGAHLCNSGAVKRAAQKTSQAAGTFVRTASGNAHRLLGRQHEPLTVDDFELGEASAVFDAAEHEDERKH